MSTEKQARIVAQYVVSSFARAHVRPYTLKKAVPTDIDGSFYCERLPEEGHWRAELGIVVSLATAEGDVVFEAGCCKEAIVATTGVTDEEARVYLQRVIAGLLLADIRVRISSVTQETGFGPITLPPLSADQLERLVQKERTS